MLSKTLKAVRTESREGIAVWQLNNWCCHETNCLQLVDVFGVFIDVVFNKLDLVLLKELLCHFALDAIVF